MQPIESNPLGWSAYMLAGRCLEMLDQDDIRRNTEFIQDEDTPEDYYQSALIHAPVMQSGPALSWNSGDWLRSGVLTRRRSSTSRRDHLSAGVVDDVVRVGLEPEHRLRRA